MDFALFEFLAEASGPSTLVKTETAAVVLICIAAGVAIAARRFEFPFTVALVLAGFAATLLGDLVAVDVSPDLILFLLVPPLLFEATLHLKWQKLKADLVPVLNQALTGTLIGTLAVGAVVHYVLGLGWAASLAFGALISATDPVAVIAFFKSLGTPKRLSVLVEGESLFNDAIAVVAFGLAVGVAKGDSFTVTGAIGDFALISAGGILIGAALGYAVSEIVLARVDDGLIETTTTLALAYGSFLLAEEFGAIIGREDLHFSGILAVVSAGLMQGNLGFKNTSPSTRVTLEHSWELLTFLVNSLVFLFIGLTVRLSALASHWWAVAVAVVTVLALRFVLTYGLSFISGLLRPNRAIQLKYQHVMFWGGLRGAISLALALTLSEAVFDPETVETIQVMTFGVVLFTLIVQGTTIAGLIRRLDLAGTDHQTLQQQRHQARLVMGRAGQDEVARLGSDGVVNHEMSDAMGRAYQDHMSVESTALVDHSRSHPEMETEMLIQARRDALIAERSALKEIVFRGLVEAEIGSELSLEIDNRMAALQTIKEQGDGDLDVIVEADQSDDSMKRLISEELKWLQSVRDEAQDS